VSQVSDGTAFAFRLSSCNRKEVELMMNRTLRNRLVAVAFTHGVVVFAGAAAFVQAAADAAPWDAPVQAVDAALARGDFRAAREAWNHAYAVALGSGHWEGMAAVGDASARISNAGGETGDLVRARQAYYEAFLRARSEGSVDGVLRVSDAYSRLGDHETARRYRDTAVRLAVRQTSPGIFARIWARLTGHYVR
jgi:tetratricopeptide (TPR) repeat protein